jgi:hypothetical protein
MMNLNGSGKKRKWPNRGVTRHLPGGTGETTKKCSWKVRSAGESVFRLRFEVSTSGIKAHSATASLSCSVTADIKRSYSLRARAGAFSWFAYVTFLQYVDGMQVWVDQMSSLISKVRTLSSSFDFHAKEIFSDVLACQRYRVWFI